MCSWECTKSHVVESYVFISGLNKHWFNLCTWRCLHTLHLIGVWWWWCQTVIAFSFHWVLILLHVTNNGSELYLVRGCPILVLNNSTCLRVGNDVCILMMVQWWASVKPRSYCLLDLVIHCLLQVVYSVTCILLVCPVYCQIQYIVNVIISLLYCYRHHILKAAALYCAQSTST